MIYRNYTLRFVLHRRSDSVRQHLQMRITPRGGKPVSFSTGLSLTSAEWDPLLGRAKGRTPEAAEANTLIAQWGQVVAEIFAHYESLSITPTAEQLRKAFARATAADDTTADYTPQPAASMTVVAAFTQFIMDRQKDSAWSDGTVTVFQTFRRLVAAFQPDTPLEKVDAEWLSAFHGWLVNQRKQQGVSVSNNLTKIRWFLRWARHKGLYHGTADQDYRPHVKGSGQSSRQIVYLTRDELHRLEDFVFDEKHLAVARDVFLFGCYTGLRTSDILRLSRADCHADCITLTTQKTHHALTIPLNQRAKELLDRYEGCRPNRRQRALGIAHPALPTPDQKTMNKHLHALMQLVGINSPTHHVYYIGAERHDEIMPKSKLITTHTARHTFIVTAISLGIPVPVIMDWTGHSDYNAMRPYIAIANDTSTQAMQRFNDF